MTSTVTFDTTALASAIEARDAHGQLAAYAPDAEITIFDYDHPPTSPRVLRGTSEIADYLVDVCARDMTHHVRTALATDDRIAFEVACQYADGSNVVCQCVAGVAGGRILWQRQTQVWDH